MKIDYNLNNYIINLLLQGKHFDEISVILNLDAKYLKYLFKNIKSYIINTLDEKNFFIVKLIERELNSNVKNNDNCFFPSEIKKYILEGKSNEIIMKDINVNEHRYIYLLRSIYYNLYSFGSSEDKVLLPIIKEHINQMNYLNKNEIKKDLNSQILNLSREKMIINNNGEIINTNSYINDIYEIDVDKEFKFITIADTHFGSVFENMDYIKKVFEYASKHGIGYIFICGDLIEGSYGEYGRCKREYRSTLSQVEHVLNDYEKDYNIKTVILLGNHDVYPIIDEGIDIAPLLSERDDFIVTGYKNSYIKLKDKYIALKHEISRVINIIPNCITFLTLAGHTHQYRFYFKNGQILMKVPTCSDYSTGSVVNDGFVHYEITFDGDEIATLDTKYISFEDTKEIVMSLSK